MRCPKCGHEGDRVIDSRSVRDGKGVRRRRECAACAQRFTTYEYVEPAAFLIVKRDGRREAYQREKLRRGILRACQKRPTAAAEIDALVERIELRLLRTVGEEIAASQIGRLVLEELRGLDQVAYVRFASVYRRFESADEFREIIDSMAVRAPEPGPRSRPPEFDEEESE
ncbi:MAG: transcriptional repressor NrdR [Candidatus Eisenbacteria bacterium]|nr:transcriptional repressor NrdR [Candidatus Eisenbacteria bacterium]